MEANMKIFLVAATALAMTGSAFAYQTYSTHPTHPTTTTTTAPGVAVSIDPNMALVAPAGLTAEQRELWDEWMSFHPGWTAEQRAEFAAMMALPPAQWTAEQRALFAEHLNHIPPGWSADQRAEFAAMVDPVRTPWMAATQTAQVDQYAVPVTTAAMAPASPAVIQPSNANPEEDARGISVISDVAYVPPGYNGLPATAVGGPIEGDDESYPPCTAERTDNCTQTYEVGSNPD
jgi:hypothetical protein